ncbi:hypothetical protein AALO_G00044350 [Alosa alosa]|uniref:Pituitary tumor-transforming gene 1 protein-interacting protein-like n=1 Tax=Alosa alosa TaxID=278164 RepID=A0AAV6HCS2_9TELE|nr:PTTG1 interacting protein b [Alosa alosa]KAG5283641.1 hypothetical protein AALO_G00044350 [Alosa alosa]
MVDYQNYVVLTLLFIFNVTVVFNQSTTDPAATCASKTNTSCGECLKNVTCLWCESSGACVEYPVRNILPPTSLCPLPQARWGVCWVNFQALIITISVVGGVLLIGLCVCFYRCCCTCGNSKKDQKLDERMEREADMRKMKHEERKAEMRSRHDEIRKKYGLMKDNGYSKFENN